MTGPRRVVGVIALALLLPGGLRAEEPAPPAPPNYVAGFLCTTPTYRPPGGPFDGWQHDWTPMLGYGRFVTDTIALELDVAPTWVEGKYTSFALVPGVVWSFSSHAYAALRFSMPVDPEWNLAVMPGVGLIHTFGRVSPILELDAVSYVGKGDPDFGLSLTAGVLIAF